jgi:hypothetical protein
LHDAQASCEKPFHSSRMLYNARKVF